MGANIKARGILTANDFNELLTWTNSEVSRRSKTPTYPAYTVVPATGVQAKREHADKFFANAKVVDSSRTDAVNTTNIIKTADLTGAIDYIRTLMGQNLK